jgi:hypothetical protein
MNHILNFEFIYGNFYNKPKINIQSSLGSQVSHKKIEEFIN